MSGVSPVPRISWPVASSSRAQLAEVVELAVEDRDDVAALALDRLVAGLQIDDREAPVAEHAAAVRPRRQQWSGPRCTIAAFMRSTRPGSGASLPRSPQIPHMPGTQGYAVVSCHVERPLDDAVWDALPRASRSPARRLSDRLAACARRPTARTSERFVERAREATALGPFGHHTHWTSPTHARPTGGDPAEQVLREGRWLREQRPRAALLLRRRLVHGRGRDGRGRRARLRRLHRDRRRGRRSCRRARRAPRSTRPPGSASTTAAACSSCRARTRSAPPRARSRGALPPVVHVHFHDYELLDARRRAALSLTLRLLARRRRPVEPGAIEAEREVAWADVCAD